MVRATGQPCGILGHIVLEHSGAEVCLKVASALHEKAQECTQQMSPQLQRCWTSPRGSKLGCARRVDFFGSEHFADKIRIFAKCINGARPFEHVDLMLMTQSL